jgi:CheY-like chemotaxis protein
MKLVLIVEDNEDLRNLLVHILSLHSIGTISAKNGLEAVNLVYEKSDICLILLDKRMPVMNGIQAYHSIRAKFDTPIVLMSGYTEDVEHYKNYDSNLYIMPKPYEIPEFIALVKTILKVQPPKSFYSLD